MIAVLLPYLQWTLETQYGGTKSQNGLNLQHGSNWWMIIGIPKKNTFGTKAPKRKKVKVGEESVTDSLSTVKIAISSIKTSPQLAVAHTHHSTA